MGGFSPCGLGGARAASSSWARGHPKRCPDRVWPNREQGPARCSTVVVGKPYDVCSGFSLQELIHRLLVVAFPNRQLGVLALADKLRR